MVVYEPIYSVPEAAKVLNINMNVLYNELIPTGRLPVVKPYEDANMKVRGVDLERLINELNPISPTDIKNSRR